MPNKKSLKGPTSEEVADMTVAEYLERHYSRQKQQIEDEFIDSVKAVEGSIKEAEEELRREASDKIAALEKILEQLEERK